MTNSRAPGVSAAALRLLHVLPSTKRVLPALVRLAVGYAAFALLLRGLYQYPWELPGVVLRLTYAATLAILDYVARGCKPLFEEWTLSFEITRAVARAMSAHYSPRVLLPKNVQYMRLQTELAGAVMGLIACHSNGTYTQTLMHNGLEHIWVRLRQQGPKTSSRRRRCVLLYYHGGGYTILSPRAYISSASALLVRIQAHVRDAAVDVEILLANYRKAPEFPYPVPPSDAHAVYKYLVNVERVPPGDIIIAGDSAGAGLVLATMLRVRDEKPHTLPRAAILTSPYVDMEMRGDQRKAPYCIVADGAVETVPRSYFPQGGGPETWGDASPVHCHLGGLPPAYIIAPEFDYLKPQAYRLMERAKEDGVDHWELEEHKHMVHVYMNLPAFILPHASYGLDAMAKYATRKFLEAEDEVVAHEIAVAA